MLKFILKQTVTMHTRNQNPCYVWTITQVKPERMHILEVCGADEEGYLNPGIAPLLAGDITDFLNEKYIDKNINEEWGKIDVQARIKYHEEQLRMLKSGNPFTWTEHGNSVKEI